MDIILQVVYTVLVFGFLIFIHELGHFVCAKISKVRVNEFAIGMGPAIFKKQKGETLYTLRVLPIGGYVAMEGEDETSDDPNSFERKHVLIRLAITLAGVFMNFILGVIITFILVVQAEALPSLTVAEFAADAISDDCGLKVGDTIVGINDRDINVYADIATAFSLDYSADPVSVTVLRDGVEMTLENVSFPVTEFADGLQGKTVDFLVYRAEKNVGTILKETCYRTAAYISMMYETVAQLLTGEMSLKYVSGPVGTSTVISDAAKNGFQSFLNLVALLSLNLGVMNLLPLPALDGGRFIFLLIELIFRRPVPKKFEAVVHFVGLVILFGLMIVVMFKDIFFPIQ